MSEPINITGLDKAALLAGLYNGAKPFISRMETMTVERAWTNLYYPRSLMGGKLVVRQMKFVYIDGRSLKVDIGGDTLDPTLYDRDNGQGAAAAVVARLREEMGE